MPRALHSLDRNPLTRKAGSYTLSGTAPSTTNWREGRYLFTGTLAASSNCQAATVVTKIAVAATLTRTSAFGAGIYGNLRAATDFAFTARMLKRTA